jgi:membrane protease YdiL (CAAX protease family)
VFGLTWVVWVPRAAGAPLDIVGQAWTWVPAIAALLAAALTGGRAAVSELGSRLVQWHVGWQWYLVVVLGPAVFSVVVAGIYVLLGGSWADAAPPAIREGPLVMLPLFLVILTLTDGLGEELAWRGFALPRLLSQHNALVASLILGVIWALWHLPLLWTEGNAMYHQPVWLLLVDIPAKSILFTWVFLHTRGSVLLAMLFHGATNLFGVSPDVASTGELTLPLLAAVAKWVLVGVVIIVDGPGLARGPRPEALPRTLSREASTAFTIMIGPTSGSRSARRSRERPEHLAPRSLCQSPRAEPLGYGPGLCVQGS